MIIEFCNVSKKYEGSEALKNLSLQIKKGEMVFLTGHSGAGKTTLLKLIMLMERVTQGKIFVNGKQLDKLSRKQIPFLRRFIGTVFQDPNLLFERSVYENVALPLIISNYEYKNIASRVRAALDLVSLTGKENLYPASLSAGEQQRVGIARSIVNKPVLFLADEPTGNLDPELSLEIMKLFERLNQTGTTMLIASHNLPLISSLSHRILTLKDGKLEKDVQNYVLNLNTKDIVPICYEFKLGNNSFFKKYLNDYKFDIVFLDPPFDSNLVEEASIFLEEKNCLTKDALVYVEIQKAKKISLPNNWECLKEKTSGDVRYYLFERVNPNL